MNQIYSYENISSEFLHDASHYNSEVVESKLK